MERRKSTQRKKIVLRIWICLMAVPLASILVLPLPGTEATAGSLPSRVPGSFAELVKEASPSVVNISAVKVIKGREQFTLPFGKDDPFRDFFERYFRDQVPREYRQKGLGSGFIIDKEGYIFTNNHVVEMAEEIRVTLSDEREFEAKIVGRDPKTDLALIKIEGAKDLIPLSLGDSDRLDVGDWVVAIGNPFNLGHTVTAGIVSAKLRDIGAGPYDNFIQTDASINPGNSGGPLLNVQGEVIGINTAIASPSGGSIGIGFAIPVNMAKDLLPQLKKGKVVRGWLGVVIQKITRDLKGKLNLKDENGALVSDVVEDGPADRAGIKRGDVILSFDGKDIKESKELPYVVSSTPVGKTVPVVVMRKGQKETIQVELGEMTDDKGEPVVSKAGPDIGLAVEEITPELARSHGLSESEGLIIVQVRGDSPAAAAGLRRGDVILEMDQERVDDLENFNKRLESYRAGDTILFLIKRQGATMYLTLEVRE